MNDLLVLKALTGIRLSDAGRHSEALEWIHNDFHGLQALITNRMHPALLPSNIGSGVLWELIQAWSLYYQGKFREALPSFVNALAAEEPWVRASSYLGQAKVRTDLGYFEDAARLSAAASFLGRRYEHLDLVAAAQGALGEVFLRCGHPRLALEAYELDLALLSPVDRFRGRVLCYQGHAFSRLGAHRAAKLAYRISAQIPGENPSPYAYAGLALLGAESNDNALVAEAITYVQSRPEHEKQHMGIAWIYIGKSKLSIETGNDALLWCRFARESLPKEYVFEHDWLNHWMIALGDRTDYTKNPPETSFELPAVVIDMENQVSNSLDANMPAEKLYNNGLSKFDWSSDLEQLWKQRSMFVP